MVWIKRLFKIIAFTLCLLLIFFGLNQVLVRKDLAGPWDMTNKIHGFYNEPEQHFDAMFFGSSHMYCTINPLLLWEETGIPSYILASQKQPLWTTYHYLKDALKTQNPKLVVIEIHMATEENPYSDEATNYSAIDYLPWSANKWELIQAAVPQDQQFNYLFNFMKYHSRWSELTQQDFDQTYLDNTDPLKGYVCLTQGKPVEETYDLSQITVQQPIDKTLAYVDKIIALAEEHHFQLLFLKSPSNATPEYEGYYHAIKTIAEENQIPYLDYNYLYAELGLDLNTDFYDPRHLNIWGTTKATKHFAQYIMANFPLTSKKDNPDYAQWDQDLAWYYEKYSYLFL